MSICAVHDVVVYHDETADVGTDKYKGHALLFVPTRIVGIHTTPLLGEFSLDYSPSKALYNRIMEVRKSYQLDKKFHFKDISGRKWGRFDLGVRLVVETGVDALRHKFSRFFKPPLCCKLAVMFYPKAADLSLYGGGEKKEQRVRLEETVLRMLLKGGLHYLYGESSEVVVAGVISDGQPRHRPLNDERTMWRIAFDDQYGRTALRDYATIHQDARITHLPSDHKQYLPDSDEYIQANLLQLTDLLLGSVIRSCYVGIAECPRPPRIGSTNYVKKDVIAYPVKEMLDKIRRGKGFERSGHFRSFSISCVSFAPDSVSFTKLSPLQFEITSDELDMKLLF